MEASESSFLLLPVELRLQIYGYVLATASVFTIGSARLIGNQADIVYRLYGQGRSPDKGLPEGHVPIISACYDPALLSTVHPFTIGCEETALDATSQVQAQRPLTALTSTCRQTYGELKTHISHLGNDGELFVSFPHGLYVLSNAPHLLRQARRVHIAGIYDPDTRLDLDMARYARERGQYQDTSARLLAQLVRATLGEFPNLAFGSVAQLEVRIYYAGGKSYSAMWNDNNGPVAVTLANLPGCHIDMACYRGEEGTGMHIRTHRSHDGERSISSSWGKLNEGRRGQPRPGTWVVEMQ